ncbi:MAG: hypothetical protein A2Y10_03730 [Planctomycetes bacterium GWF2_41_51]|nr:MAG: hypothetical protein A2Y10_03730 [Planctomycetes bacterium GWF2_41_51]HBG26049.1 hypothetical protein [Phycisphaerales bacterium]
MKKKEWLIVLLFFLLMPTALVMALEGPDVVFLEFDGDYDSTLSDMTGDGFYEVTDAGYSTYGSWMNSGLNWTHVTYDGGYPYMGSQMYKVQCNLSPHPVDNDRSEQMLITGWYPADGYRYFSFAVYIPTTCSTPANWLMLSQWHQDGDHSPPLYFSWQGDTNKFRLARYYDGVVNGEYDPVIWGGLWESDFTVQKGKWYYFQFTVKPGLNNTGLVDFRMMNSATGLWEQEYLNDAITIGFQYLPDGNTPAPQNYQFKLGTYRGTQQVVTKIYFDNIRYGKTWAGINKGHLTGSHQCVMDLPFDESSGTVANDASAYNNDGQAMGGITHPSNGISGRCYWFDGVNDYVRIPLDTVDFDFGNYMTVSCWMKTTANRNVYLVSQDESPNSYKYRLTVSSGASAFRVKHPDGTTPYAQATLGSSLFDGEWHHMVGTYNRFSPDGNRIKLYIDGELAASAAGSDKPLLRGADYLNIGKIGSTDWYYGALDEVLLYNWALTADEVEDLYSSY